MEFDQLGEFGLIERIQSLIGGFKDPSVLSIGDDTAIVSGPDRNKKIVFTTDAMIEGIHFNRDYTPMESLGWKALAINIYETITGAVETISGNKQGNRRILSPQTASNDNYSISGSMK